jgi:hypothetical protein
MYSEFPKDVVQCQQGDYILREGNDRRWKVFYVEDIFFLSRLIPLNQPGAQVLVEQIEFSDSAPPPRWREIHLLVSEFDKGYASAEDAIESLKQERLGRSVQGLLRRITEFPVRNCRIFKQSATDLKQRYQRATTAVERRAVCLQAIDDGVIQRGGPVSTVDEIFGTHFAQDLPTARERRRTAVIDFVTFVPSPDNSRAAPHLGWYLAVEYDPQGTIQNYYLSNLHK